MKFRVILSLLFMNLTAFADDKPAVTLKNIPTDDDTSITIQKGRDRNLNCPRCTKYEIIEGRDEVIHADGDYDDKKAKAAWKTACNEWTAHMKELNKENKILSLSCGKPTLTKENHLYTYESTGTYKMKVLIRDDEKK